jgi:multidrug resistance efflux pump
VVGRQVVVREVLAGGKSRRMAFVVPEDARIVAGSGEGSLADLRVGDEVAVTYELGEERHHVLEIRVTRAAPPEGVE